MLLEHAEKFAEDLRLMGRRAIEQASRAGVPAYYMDARLGAGIIRLMPDGTRQRVRVDGGKIVVIENLAGV